jgi:UDP-N-acetylglucosamine 2-epimerase (non-hydrolysing)
MAGHLRALRRFAERHDDVAIAFPVHPNPSVRSVVHAELDGAVRIHCIEPLNYPDFVHLASKARLIASDSGGIQEEAPSLGVPVLILRDTTERPEVLECGVGRLVGHSGERFEAMLEDAWRSDEWPRTARAASNPFGAGDAGEQIATHVEEHFAAAMGLVETL